MHKALLIFTVSALIFGTNSKAANEVSSHKETIKVSRADTDAVILKKHLELCKLQSPLNAKLHQKVITANSLISNCDYVIKAINSNNDRQISSQSRQIANSIRNKENSLKYNVRRVDSLEKELKTLKIDKVKQGEVAQLEMDLEKILAEIKMIKQPFTNKKNEFLAKMKAAEQKSKLSTLLRPLVTPETDINGKKVTSKAFSANFSTAFANSNWYVNNKRIAWAHIRIRPIPNRTGTMKKMAGKYPVQSIGNNSIWFWAGKYQICLVVDDKQYQTREKVKELAQKLFKLPELERSSDSKVIKNCIDVYEHLEKIGKEQQKATKELNKQRWKLRRKISALKKQGYQSPETIAKKRNELNQVKSELAVSRDSIVELGELGKILKLPTAERKKNVPKLERKIAGMRQQVIVDCLKYKKQKSEIISPAEFDIANAKYQAIINKIIRMPKSKEFAAINETVITAWFGSPRTTVSWNLDLASGYAHNWMQVFRGTIKPFTNQSSPKGMIDGKYAIYAHNDSIITVKVGPWLVSLSAAFFSAYRDKDILLKAVKELYDLDAIAELSK